MALINPDHYFYLDSHHIERCGEPERRDAAAIFNYKDFDDGLDYYYMEFKDGPALGRVGLHTFVDHVLLKKIRDLSDKTHLVINNSHEAFHSVVDDVYKHIVIGHHLPPEKIILMSGSFDIVEVIEVVAQKYRRTPLKAELVLEFESTATIEANMQEFVSPQTLQNTDYSKKFLNLNRRWRIARPTFVGLLVANNLLDQGYVSLAPSDCKERWPKAWHGVCGLNAHFPELIAQLTEHREHIINLPPLYLDTRDLVTNRAEIDQSSRKLYENTYVSLVAETNYYTCHSGFEPSRFMSEKTFKPILFKHPFVYISTPGMISAIKQIGYQTFNPIIDETYDTIQNDGDRMLAIIEETRRLCKLKPEQLTEFLNSAREVCEYNFRVLKSRTQHTYKLNF